MEKWREEARQGSTALPPSPPEADRSIYAAGPSLRKCVCGVGGGRADKKKCREGKSRVNKFERALSAALQKVLLSF